MSPRLLPLACLGLTAGLAAADAAKAPALNPADANPPAQNKVTITVKGDKRVIESNGIPDHKVSKFPNRGNPNAISEQKYHLEVPANPKPAEGGATGRMMSAWGVALNGVVFDPGTAEVYNDGDRSNPWHYEALRSNTTMGTTPRIPTGLGLDDNHGHVQPNGAYHYHGLPTLLVERLSTGEKKMVHVGWAADGYPAYAVYGYANPTDPKSELKKMKNSYRLKTADRGGDGKETPTGKPDGSYALDFEYVAGSGDLDEFGGRTGVTPEFPKGTYYYVLTEDFPFIPRKFKGTPDPSFSKQKMDPHANLGGQAGGTGQRKGGPGQGKGGPGMRKGGPGGPPPFDGPPPLDGPPKGEAPTAK
jgi:YHYH protein